MYMRPPQKMLLILMFLVVGFFSSTDSQAAHPLRLTDYSPQSRVELEIGFGKMKFPLKADYIHYLLGVEADVYRGLHLNIAIPFSGYNGAEGVDNFIRGNMLLGLSYKLPLLEWLSAGFGVRFYLPTYERANSIDFGTGIDPRRAVLAHWHYRFQYALEDSFPIVCEMAVKFEKYNFFAQLEGAFTWAPNIRERDGIDRKDNVLILQYGLGIGYDILGYVEINASITGLYDPAENARNIGDILGLPYSSPRSLTVFTVGPRVQYKWAVFRFEANIPIEGDFRKMLEPYYLFALQAQF